MNNTPLEKPAVQEALQKYQQAAEDLMDTVKRCYPIGTVIECKIRYGVRGRFEIIGYSDAWWYQPNGVRIRNLKTGRTRRIAVSPYSEIVTVE